MVKIRKPKKENDNILPIENTEALNDTLNKSEEFINNNKNIIYSVLGVIVLLILGFSAFSYFFYKHLNRICLFSRSGIQFWFYFSNI